MKRGRPESHFSNERIGLPTRARRSATTTASRHRLAVPIVACCLLVTSAAADAEDWSTFRNDNARTGSVSESISFPLTRAWRYTSPSAPAAAWAGPDRRVIEGKELRHRVLFDDALHVTSSKGRVYFGSSVDHRVRCMDSATGGELWSFITGGPVRLAPTFWQGKLLFGSDDGFVYCLEADTGKTIWKLRAGPADEWLLARGEMVSRWPVRTGVMVDEGVAYFGAGIFPHEDVYLYAVNAGDGSIVWNRDNISETEAGRDDLSPQGYLLTNDDILFVPSGRSLPAAFDKRTGKRLHKRYHGWRGDGGGIIGGTGALLADGQIYSAGPHHMLAMDQKTGDVGFGWFTGRQMAVAGDDAFVATGESVKRMNRVAYAEGSRERHKIDGQMKGLYGKLRRAKDDEAKTLREQLAPLKEQRAATEQAGVKWDTPSEHESALAATANAVFVGGNETVVAYDVETGEEIWSADVAGEARGLSVADGRLLVSTTAGDVIAFAADGDGESTDSVAQSAAKNPYAQDEWSKVYATAAEEILARANVKQGFCLVVGAETGRLAYHLAKRSDLKIYAVEPDAEKVAKAREALSAAGLYGYRVVVHQAELADIGYSNYFANLIVSDSLLRHGSLPGDPKNIVRHLKPVGGVACLGRPSGAPGETPSAAELTSWLDGMDLGTAATIDREGSWTTLARGGLPGAGNWSHLYGEPGNTASSDDRRVKGDLGVLWYGDPGAGKMVNRHAGAVGPLAVNGRLFVQGHESVMAYDAYNGMFLWERGNEKAIRTGVFKNYNPGNLVAGENNLFVMIEDRCVELDGASGEIVRTYELPTSRPDKKFEWGYLAYNEGILYGTATVREEIEKRLQRRGRVTVDATDAIFAIDTKTGEHLWTYEGKSISHHTIALGPERVFFVDSSLTAEQRQALLDQDKTELKKLTGEEAKQAEERMKRIDVRMAVALDARTGKKAWSEAVDVTDCSKIGIGGGELTLMYHNNVLVFCGANANGHYWKQFVSGEFKKRRLVCLSAEDGHKLWAKDANYRHRPIVVEDRIFAEPWAYDLYSGAQQTRKHPLTGQDVPWSMIRPGHHCGMLTGCPNMLMFRSGFTGFFDLAADTGTRHFAGHRMGCWVNAVPANGLVMIPESSAGCVCLFSISATITLEPRQSRRPWSIYSSVGAKTPVKRMALNLGAPGDRKDARGVAWLAYPRPNTSRKQTGLDLALDLGESFVDGGQFNSQNFRSVSIKNTETPWLFSSSADGLRECRLPLLGEDDAPADYTVKLYFADLAEGAQPGERVFDVKLQGQTVLENFDVATEADGAGKALVREVSGIHVTDNLHVELVPKTEKPSQQQSPLLSAIEVVQSSEGE